MVPSLKTWESRSLPDLPKTEFASSRLERKNAVAGKPSAAFLFCASDPKKDIRPAQFWRATFAITGSPCNFLGELMPTFERIRSNGEQYVPHQFDDGLYRVADPTLGKTKHHSANQIAIREDEILGYLKRGFSLRMRGMRSGQSNLIAALNIMIRP